MSRDTFRVAPGFVLAVAGFSLALSGRSAAGGPRDDLLRLVPPNTAVCFVVQGLRDQAKAVGESPFAAWASEKVGPKLTASNEFAAIKAFEKMIEDQIGIPLKDLRDDILGDVIVLAYQPGPPGKPDAEHGVVMLNARSPEKLRKLIDRFNQVQKDRGEITELKEVAYKGTSYTRRAKPDGGGEFYHARGGLFAFSGQETAIREVIDQAANPAAAAAPVAESLKKLGVQSAFLTFWVNPRRLDADLAARAAASEDPSHKAFLGQFAKVWSAVDGLAFYLDVKKDVELGLSATFDPAKLPAEVRPLLSSAPTRSAVWQLVPEDALFAVGGRADVNALLTVVASFAPAGERDAIRGAIEKAVGPVVGKQNLPGLLGGVGPDWGAWVTAPSAADKTWVPTWTAAVRVRDDEAARKGVLKVLGFWAQMAQFDYNQKHDDQIELRDDEADRLKVSYLVNDKLFPPGFRPAFAVKDGYLVVAGSPDAVRRFAAPPRAEKPSAEAPLLRMSGSAVRAYLQAHKADIGKWIAGMQDKEEDEVTRDLVKLAEVLEPVDRVELLARGDERRIGIALRVKFVKPLAK